MWHLCYKPRWSNYIIITTQPPWGLLLAKFGATASTTTRMAWADQCILRVPQTIFDITLTVYHIGPAMLLFQRNVRIGSTRNCHFGAVTKISSEWHFRFSDVNLKDHKSGVVRHSPDYTANEDTSGRLWPALSAGLLCCNFFGQPGSVSAGQKLWVGWVGRGYTEISRYFPASWINWFTLVTKIKLLYSLRF